MSNPQLSRADLLDAFRKAIVVTQGTVEAGTPAADELAKMLDRTTVLLAEADEAAWHVAGPTLRRLYRRAVARG